MKLPTTREPLKKADVKLVGPHEVLKYAHEISQLLQGAERFYGDYMGIEDIIARACIGKFQIWLAREEGRPFFCVVTEILVYPRKKVLNVLQIGGEELKGFHKNMDIGERWAVAMGCTHVEFHCREGIALLMEKQGYEKRAITMHKKLHSEVKEN